jgi:transitional endoplasmic reticulum ATPase
VSTDRPSPALSPAQRAALQTLEQQLADHRVAVLSSRAGTGKTTILRALFARTGGVYLTSREFVEASASRDPLALDETVYHVLRQALETNDTVIVDDFQLVSLVACCVHAYPRQNFLGAVLLPLAAMARDAAKRVVFTAEGMPLMGLHERYPMVWLGAFAPDDYRAICASYLSQRAAGRIDYDKVHRFAPKLTARQLRNTCVAFRGDDTLDTERFVE